MESRRVKREEVKNEKIVETEIFISIFQSRLHLTTATTPDR